VLSSQRKVQINSTDFTRIGDRLDNTKDVPIKKNQSAYVLFGNEVRVDPLSVAAKSSDPGEVPRTQSHRSRKDDSEAVVETDKSPKAKVQGSCQAR